MSLLFGDRNHATHCILHLVKQVSDPEGLEAISLVINVS